MTKAELNAQLAAPLSASALKKITLADLQAKVDAQKPTTKKARTLGAKVFCEPAKSADDVKPIRAGTKRAILADALAKGATMDELVALLGWDRSVVSSAFTVDLKPMGYGVSRDDAGVYRLTMPSQIKRPAITLADQSRADALVAACR